MANAIVPDFDSTSIDTLSARLEQIRGLASCGAALSDAMERFSLHMPPIDDALPMLNVVMMEMADEAQDAATRLWEQHQELRRLLGASHG